MERADSDKSMFNFLCRSRGLVWILEVHVRQQIQLKMCLPSTGIALADPHYTFGSENEQQKLIDLQWI